MTREECRKRLAHLQDMQVRLARAVMDQAREYTESAEISAALADYRRVTELVQVGAVACCALEGEDGRADP